MFLYCSWVSLCFKFRFLSWLNICQNSRVKELNFTILIRLKTLNFNPKNCCGRNRHTFHVDLLNVMLSAPFTMMPCNPHILLFVCYSKNQILGTHFWTSFTVLQCKWTVSIETNVLNVHPNVINRLQWFPLELIRDVCLSCCNSVCLFFFFCPFRDINGIFWMLMSYKVFACFHSQSKLVQGQSGGRSEVKFIYQNPSKDLEWNFWISLKFMVWKENMAFRMEFTVVRNRVFGSLWPLEWECKSPVKGSIRRLKQSIRSVIWIGV